MASDTLRRASSSAMGHPGDEPRRALRQSAASGTRRVLEIDPTQLDAAEQNAVRLTVDSELDRPEGRIHQLQRERHIDAIACLDSAGVAREDLAKAPRCRHVGLHLATGTGVVSGKYEPGGVGRARDSQIRRTVDRLPA